MRHVSRKGTPPMSKLDRQPKVPDYFPQNEDEHNLAQGIQAQQRRFGHAPAIVALGSTVAAAVLGGALYLSGKGGEASSPTPDENRSPGVSSTNNPGEKDPGTQTSELDGLSVAEFKNDSKAIANAYYQDLNLFLIAGATEEAAQADERYTMKDSEYVDKISADINADFVNAYLVDDWQENSNLVQYVDDLFAEAKTVRWARIGTYGGGTGNVEPYESGYILESVDSTGPLTASTRFHQYDNRDMNMADEGNLTGVNPNDVTGGDTITWVKVGDKYKISDVVYYEG